MWGTSELYPSHSPNEYEIPHKSGMLNSKFSEQSVFFYAAYTLQVIQIYGFTH